MHTILVTGGAGYIGSHACVELLNAGYEVVVVDNLSNSKEIALDRVKEITGKQFYFYKADLRDAEHLEFVFQQHKIHAVIHFAGLKAVGESTKIPLAYYDNNITGTFQLCKIMQKNDIPKLVFSSSATVYGDPAQVPIKEDFMLSATNPYGRTKLIIEQFLRDLYASDNTWHIVLLRYFNPIGAHPTGKIGEDPHGIPNNLMPYISQVAIQKLPYLSIFGNDYPTIDGTGVRDYIHVVDLAKGHVKALEKLEQEGGCFTFNLGTGKGYSVLEMVTAFEKTTGMNIPYKIVERRPGDIATCFADPSRANKELQWKTEKTIDDMCKDLWKWQVQNPNGYE